MKVITKDNYYYRVSDEEAETKVKTQGYTYSTKEKWKRAVKANYKKAPESIEPTEPTEKKKKYQKPKRS